MRFYNHERKKSLPLCRLSDPKEPHKLCQRTKPRFTLCITCKGQHHLRDKGRYYYYCATCDLEFHRGCHLFPPEIKHPFHLIHPLTLTFLDPRLNSSKIPEIWLVYCSESYIDISGDASDGNHKRCKSCRKNITYISDTDYVSLFDMTYYHCPICNFSLHSSCLKDSPPLTIENLKSHDHTLTLFPRQLPLPCDACGFPLNTLDVSVYSCLLCNYMVHRRCIYLPRVIKITRHHHRLSITLPPLFLLVMSCLVAFVAKLLTSITVNTLASRDVIMLFIQNVQQRKKCGMGKILRGCLKKKKKLLSHSWGLMK